MRPAIYGAYHHITVLGKEEAPADHLYDVVGGLCDERTTSLQSTASCPKSTAATCSSSTIPARTALRWATTTNGKLRSAEVLLKTDGTHALIRRAETPADYFATLDVTPYYKNLEL